MTRVTFVDDDRMFSRLTQVQLSKRLPQCELVFHDSAHDAISELERVPSDIIFSDMQMPEMDGEEFLTRVAQLHPQTVRFAWSGQVKPVQLERFLKVAHQIMNKPTPRDTLVELISSLAEFRDRINNPALLEFLSGTNQKQFDAAGVQRVLDLIDCPNSTAKEIADVIDKSPVARARLLGIVNSSLYSPSVAVCETERAIAMLGFTLVRGVYLLCGLKCDVFSKHAQVAFTQCFHSGLEAAATLRKLGTMKELSIGAHNSAMIAAIFHELGQVQFSIFDGERYASLQARSGKDKSDLIERELECYGVDRFTVAAYILMLWGVDSRACRIIASLGSPTSDRTDLARLVESALI